MANLPPGAVLVSGLPFIPMPNPLAVKVSALRKPELLQAAEPEYSEDGDILHDLLSSSGANGGSISASELALGPRCLPGSVFTPALVFPAGSRGRHFVGEFFRALLSFRNSSSTYPLTRLYFRIELVTPQNQRHVLHDREVPRLDILSNRDIRIEQQVAEEGQYTLSISVSFSDPTNELKRFSWSTTFVSERCVCEVNRKIYPLPLMPLVAQQRSGGDGTGAVVTTSSGGVPKHIVAVSLQNVTDIPIVLTNVRLIARAGFQSTAVTSSASNATGVGGSGSFVTSYTGGGKDSLVDAYLQPKETRTFSFEVSSTLLQQQNSTTPGNLAQQGGKSAASPMGAAALPKPTDIGHVEWEWRRQNGDGGVDFSSVLRLPRPLTRPDFDVYFFPQAAATADAGGVGFATVNEPLVVHLVVVNRSQGRRDVALHIHPHKLLPYFTYTGCCVKPLGIVEKGIELSASVTIVPLLPGLLNAVGSFELRDARQPEVVLWPIRPSSSMPPPLVQSLAGGPASFGASLPSTPGGVLSLPAEQWPLRHFDVLVF